MRSEIVLGLDKGDEAKGKITYKLATRGDFTHCLRFNGGNNSGRTIYVDGQKVVNHVMPTGIVCKLKSIIGPGCVVNEKGFFQELENLTKIIPDAEQYIKIAHNAHVIQGKHIEEELSENRLGTTRKGIGPAYRDKYARTGIRAEDVKSFEPFLVDVYEELYGQSKVNVLCEGAQAIGLDVDWGDFPYVTSSHCGIGSAINSGISLTSIANIHGVIKAYSTYVGTKEYQEKDNEELKQMASLGKEYGSTTGRLRQTNYLDVPYIRKHASLNSVTTMHVNKMDILQEMDVWKIIDNNEIVDLKNEKSFIKYLQDNMPDIKDWRFYYSPE